MCSKKIWFDAFESSVSKRKKACPALCIKRWFDFMACCAARARTKTKILPEEKCTGRGARNMAIKKATPGSSPGSCPNYFFGVIASYPL